MCIKVCPKNATSLAEGHCVIDYDKCIACGNCFKICKENAIKLDIPLEKIKLAISSLDNSNRQNETLNTLISDNKIVQEELKLHISNFKNIISKLNEAVIIVGEDNQVVCSNMSFISMLDRKSRSLLRDNKDKMEGRLVSDFIDSNLHLQLMEVQDRGKDMLWLNSKLGDVAVSVSIHSISRGTRTMMIFRNITDSLISRDEAAGQIRAVIDQNMAMVQKIGFLLGEEVSQTTKILYKTMQTIDPRADEK